MMSLAGYPDPRSRAVLPSLTALGTDEHGKALQYMKHLYHVSIPDFFEGQKLHGFLHVVTASLLMYYPYMFETYSCKNEVVVRMITQFAAAKLGTTFAECSSTLSKWGLAIKRQFDSQKKTASSDSSHIAQAQSLSLAVTSRLSSLENEVQVLRHANDAMRQQLAILLATTHTAAKKTETIMQMLTSTAFPRPIAALPLSPSQVGLPSQSHASPTAVAPALSPDESPDVATKKSVKDANMPENAFHRLMSMEARLGAAKNNRESDKDELMSSVLTKLYEENGFRNLGNHGRLRSLRHKIIDKKSAGTLQYAMDLVDAIWDAKHRSEVVEGRYPPNEAVELFLDIDDCIRRATHFLEGKTGAIAAQRKANWAGVGNIVKRPEIHAFITQFIPEDWTSKEASISLMKAVKEHEEKHAAMAARGKKRARRT
jgi:hypothetical protein